MSVMPRGDKGQLENGPYFKRGAYRRKRPFLLLLQKEAVFVNFRLNTSLKRLQSATKLFQKLGPERPGFANVQDKTNENNSNCIIR